MQELNRAIYANSDIIQLKSLLEPLVENYMTEWMITPSFILDNKCFL